MAPVMVPDRIVLVRAAVIGLVCFFVLGFIALVASSALAKDRIVMLSLLLGMVFTVATAVGVWQIIRRFEPPVHELDLPATEEPPAEPAAEGSGPATS